MGDVGQSTSQFSPSAWYPQSQAFPSEPWSRMGGGRLDEALALLGWQGVSLKRGSESEEGARCKVGPSCRQGAA